MTRKLIVVVALVLGGVSVAGCAPLVGAGVAVVADEHAERQGGNLF